MAKVRNRTAALIATALALTSVSSVTQAEDALLRGFREPPSSAKPRVWWHWMNGNVTKAGITKDIEWMSRVGIGGVQTFDVGLYSPQVVDQRIVYGSAEWKDAVRHSVTLADQLGLEFAIAGSPGWSETGGPWVPPEDGMKKLVWSEIEVARGRSFNGVLPLPPRTTGPYHDVRGIRRFAPPNEPTPEHYRDVAVLAYRVAQRVRADVKPRMFAAGKALDAEVLSDGSFATSVDVPRSSPGASASVEISYPAEQVIRSATIALQPLGRMLFDPVDVLPVLEYETSPGTWRKIVDVPLVGDVPATVSFAPIQARRYRLTLQPQRVLTTKERIGNAPGAVTDAYRPPQPESASIAVAELRLSAEAVVDRHELKAGYAVARDYYELTGPANESGVAPDTVVDLTQKMSPDGRLHWTPPPGTWRVLRFGSSLTGTTNHPATPEATGLEVDKLDRAAMERYLDAYLGLFRDATGAALFGKRGLTAFVADSIEVGAFNWTPELLEHFQQLRGYDPRPWLPTIAGVIVGSRVDSDRFLYDFRRTIGEMLVSEHYRAIREVAQRHGITVYGEALEAGRPTLGDDMAMRRHADIPMAAMWTYSANKGPRPVFLADMKGAASVAHVYGQNVVAAESLTSGFAPWAFAPKDLKSVIDLEFAYGINRPVIHSSVHQPLDDKQPGFSLLVFGQNFNRHETWAEMAKPWMDYISRSSFLLQQGRDRADVAYFYGEEAPLTGLFKDALVADAPRRYAFDFVNADIVNNKLKNDGTDLVSASGSARYKVLYLSGSSERMTLSTLRRIASLVQSGATVVGVAPQRSPALNENQAEFDVLVKQLWSGASVTSVGKGRVIATRDVEAALAQIGVAPDFEIVSSKQTEVLFLHRQLADADVYFVTNRRDRSEQVDARFRVAGKVPEIWRADTGETQPVSYRIESGSTLVSLPLAPHDAYFVVFRSLANEFSVTVEVPRFDPVASLNDGWRVQFQPDRGAPESVELPVLAPLNEHSNDGIKYFSGISTYQRQFSLPKGQRPGEPLLLDLGEVADLAEVRVNGKLVGTVWKSPYRLNIGGAVKRGVNQLEVRVANLWVNRLIGDAQPGTKKITFTTLPTYHADAPLRPSGLLGPVWLLSSR